MSLITSTQESPFLHDTLGAIYSGCTPHLRHRGRCGWMYHFQVGQIILQPPPLNFPGRSSKKDQVSCRSLHGIARLRRGFLRRASHLKIHRKHARGVFSKPNGSSVDLVVASSHKEIFFYLCMYNEPHGGDLCFAAAWDWCHLAATAAGNAMVRDEER